MNTSLGGIEADVTTVPGRTNSVVQIKLRIPADASDGRLRFSLGPPFTDQTRIPPTSYTLLVDLRARRATRMTGLSETLSEAVAAGGAQCIEYLYRISITNAWTRSRTS